MHGRATVPRLSASLALSQSVPRAAQASTSAIVSKDAFEPRQGVRLGAAHGLPFASKQQWEREERTLVRRGLSPFSAQDQRHERVKVATRPPHLESSPLLAQISAMVDRVEVAEAYAKLKVANPAALRPIIFNIVIEAALRIGRPHLAFEAYALMRQRGVAATPHTYACLITGLSRRAKMTPRIRDRIKHVHRQWVALCAEHPDTWTADQARSFASSQSNVPTNAFLQAMGKAGDIAALYEAFYSMPKAGPRAPDLQTYTLALQALAQRAQEDDAESAIAIWNLLVQDEQVSEIDGHAFSALSEALQSGTKAQRLAVLHLARACFHLIGPLGAQIDQITADVGLLLPSTRRRGGPMQLHYKALSSIFRHLGQLQLVSTAQLWLRQILSSESMAAVFDGTQAEQLLYGLSLQGEAQAAHDILTIMLASAHPRHRPTRSCFAYALQACSNSTDLEQAFQIAGMQLNAPKQEARQGAVDAIGADSEQTRATSMGSVRGDVKCIAIVMQLAHGSGDATQAERALRLAEATHWLPWDATGPRRERRPRLLAASAGGDVNEGEAAEPSDANMPPPVALTEAVSAASRERVRTSSWEPRLARALLGCLELARGVPRHHRPAIARYLQQCDRCDARSQRPDRRNATAVMLRDEWTTSGFSELAMPAADATESIRRKPARRMTITSGERAIARPAYFGSPAPTKRVQRERGARTAPRSTAGAPSESKMTHVRRARPEVVQSRLAAKVLQSYAEPVLRRLADHRPPDSKGI